jgi:hypothetical protein
MLTVGKQLHVTLHRNAQRWPKPAAFDDGVPVRYVRSLEPVVALIP